MDTSGDLVQRKHKKNLVKTNVQMLKKQSSIKHGLVEETLMYKLSPYNKFEFYFLVTLGLAF